LATDDGSAKQSKRKRAGTMIRVSLVVAACLGLLIARIIWPSSRIDAISIWLLVIVTIIILAPELRLLLPYISEAKIGPVTLKLREDIQKVFQDVETAEETISQEISKEPDVFVLREAAEESDEIRSLLKSNVDPRQVLVILSIDLEKKIRDRLTEAGIPEATRPMPLARMVDIGQAAGVFPKEIVPIVREFWTVRNSVVHSVDVQIDNATLYSLIDAGLEVLGLLSVEKLARETACVDEKDLTQEDHEEFETIAAAVKSLDEYYPIPNGQAIRRNTKKGETDFLTAIYPIETGNRYIQYRIDIKGGTDKLVRKTTAETVPSVRLG
jgi:hypothetical protein